MNGACAHRGGDSHVHRTAGARTPETVGLHQVGRATEIDGAADAVCDLTSAARSNHDRLAELRRANSVRRGDPRRRVAVLREADKPDAIRVDSDALGICVQPSHGPVCPFVATEEIAADPAAGLTDGDAAGKKALHSLHTPNCYDDRERPLTLRRKGQAAQWSEETELKIR